MHNQQEAEKITSQEVQEASALAHWLACNSSTWSTVPLIFGRLTFRWSCCTTRSCLFSLYSLTWKRGREREKEEKERGRGRWRRGTEERKLEAALIKANNLITLTWSLNIKSINHWSNHWSQINTQTHIMINEIKIVSSIVMVLPPLFWRLVLADTVSNIQINNWLSVSRRYRYV